MSEKAEPKCPEPIHTAGPGTECGSETFDAVRFQDQYDKVLIYDVGMHCGEDTEYYLKKGFRVVAFEANPELVEMCNRKFIEEIKADRLTILHGALAPNNYAKKISFYVNDISEWGTVNAERNNLNYKRGSSSKLIEVDRIDIRKIVNTYGVPFFVKIDIEGMDRYVLGALAEFSARPKHLSIESEKVNFRQLKAELKILYDLGYRKFRAVQQKNIPGTTITTEDIYGVPIKHTFPAHSSGPFGDDLQQPWLDYEQILQVYRKIFTKYRLFGDISFLRYHVKGGGRLLDAVELLIHRPLPGWYDTHASR
jgi:FkbM family methyltransferase